MTLATQMTKCKCRCFLLNPRMPFVTGGHVRNHIFQHGGAKGQFGRLMPLDQRNPYGCEFSYEAPESLQSLDQSRHAKDACQRLPMEVGSQSRLAVLRSSTNPNWRHADAMLKLTGLSCKLLVWQAAWGVSVRVYVFVERAPFFWGGWFEGTVN